VTNWPFDPLESGIYDVIVADPPWAFKTWSRTNQETGKGAIAQYSLMDLDAIKLLPVDGLARSDALLLLWSPSWAVLTGQAQEVARAWGFTPVTELVWRKITRNGKARWGTGYWARSLHECVVLSTRGKPPRKAFPSCFDGIAREHSRKPDEFYQLVRERTQGRRANLFSRQTREGFESWGLEHGKFDRETA
jgi:N6-adenosine-specific RNA methylase IME4